MNSSNSRHLRILPELRAVQVERSYQMYPCENLYFDVKYDLGNTLVPENFKNVGTWSALWAVVTSDAGVIEVPEPLWLRFLPKNVALILAWKVGGVLRGRRRFTVAYSIENNEFPRMLGGGRRIPPLLVAAAIRALGAVSSLLFDRLAFGSAGSEELYGTLRLSGRVATRVFPELPAAASSPVSGDDVAGPNAVFVGRLEVRKGINELLEAWPIVETDLPEAVLTIVGDGPLAPKVRKWASERPSHRRVLGFLEHSDLEQLVAHNRVAVAPSIPDGRWREQIGLPIGEALALGLTVVTTSETGIAGWLIDHGHRVVPVADINVGLGDAMRSALTHPLDRSEARASLPDQPGRIYADHWLHSVGTDGR